MNELALFAGAGGGILGGKLLGWKTICAVEYEPHAAAILAKRQNDGILKPFPIWDDVRTFDGKSWKGLVDVVSGGFPCQDISCAGKRKGIEGERSGLWGEMARIIREVQPRFVFVENSPMLTIRGLGRVLGDLAEMGYNARWGVLGARHCGAGHKRDRIWILADANQVTNRFIKVKKAYWDFRSRPTRQTVGNVFDYIDKIKIDFKKWEIESSICGIVDGVPFGVDRIERIGNGQVPAVVKLAWEILTA